MSGQLLSSKIVIVEEEPTLRQVQGVPTAVLGAVGVTEKGPVGTSTLVSSFAEYVKIFGGYTANGYLPNAIEGFFAEGGQEAHIVRTVHYTDVTNAASKTSAAATLALLTASIAATSGAVTSGNIGPYDLEPGQHLDIKIDGAGSATVVTFTATSGSVESGAQTFNISDAQTLTVAIDGGSTQTITFHNSNFVDHTAATAVEVAAVINAGITGAHASIVNAGKVTITSDRRGNGSSVHVTGGSANGVLGFSTSTATGGGNVSNIDATTAAEVVSAILAAVAGETPSVSGGAVKISSGSTGSGSSVQVTGASTAVAIGFDNAIHSGLAAGTLSTLRVDAKYDGTYGNALTITTAAATSGDADEFNLTVLKSGVIVEVWPNLSMTDADANFVETVINDSSTGSSYIAVTDLDSGAPSPADLPALGTFGPLAGGGDGLSSLADNDFIGTDAAKNGIRALDIVQDLSLLIVPERATSAVHNAMLAYCETTRDKQCFAVLDPPAGQSTTGIITYVTSTAAIQELSEFGAIYWPRVTVLNPSKSVFGNVANITVPPSGHIAGIYARTDSARPGGVYDPPAGTEQGKFTSIVGFETNEVLEEAKRDLVFPKRINPLTTSPGQPRYIDGARTLKSSGNFPTVAERRGAIFIEQSTKNSLQFARHKNNNAQLRAQVTRTVTNFLVEEMKKDAFRSRDPKTAFFVDFGDALNPPAVEFSGQLIGRIGIATNKPAEFLVLRFSQDTRAFDQSQS